MANINYEEDYITLKKSNVELNTLIDKFINDVKQIKNYSPGEKDLLFEVNNQCQNIKHVLEKYSKEVDGVTEKLEYNSNESKRIRSELDILKKSHDTLKIDNDAMIGCFGAFLKMKLENVGHNRTNGILTDSVGNDARMVQFMKIIEELKIENSKKEEKINDVELNSNYSAEISSLKRQLDELNEKVALSFKESDKLFHGKYESLQQEFGHLKDEFSPQIVYSNAVDGVAEKTDEMNSQLEQIPKNLESLNSEVFEKPKIQAPQPPHSSPPPPPPPNTNIIVGRRKSFIQDQKSTDVVVELQRKLSIRIPKGKKKSNNTVALDDQTSCDILDVIRVRGNSLANNSPPSELTRAFMKKNILPTESNDQ